MVVVVEETVDHQEVEAVYVTPTRRASATEDQHADSPIKFVPIETLYRRPDHIGISLLCRKNILVIFPMREGIPVSFPA